MSEPIYKHLNNKQLQHVNQSFDGPVSRFTIERLKTAIAYQKSMGVPCHECNGIARTLGVTA